MPQIFHSAIRAIRLSRAQPRGEIRGLSLGARSFSHLQNQVETNFIFLHSTFPSPFRSGGLRAARAPLFDNLTANRQPPPPAMFRNGPELPDFQNLNLRSITQSLIYSGLNTAQGAVLGGKVGGVAASFSSARADCR